MIDQAVSVVGGLHKLFRHGASQVVHIISEYDLPFSEEKVKRETKEKETYKN